MKLDNKYLQKLLDTPMDRKQFLRHLGVAILGIIGINQMISLLLQSHPETRKLTESTKTKSKFGGGRYGS